MSSGNKKLAVLVGVLLAASALTYWNGVRRADRFERGQKFLPNLNPDEVGNVSITDAKGAVITLVRSADGYTVKEANGYRARNDAANRLIRDLLAIELEKELGSGDDFASEVGIDPLADDGVALVLKNQAGADMVQVRVGKTAEEGGGRFVARQDGEKRTVFLSRASVRIDHEVRDYLQREIVDVASSDIVRIEGPDFVLARAGEGSPLELETPPGKKAKSSEVSKLSSFLNRLSFEKVFLADEADVRDLDFAQALRVDLDDQSGYLVSYAKLGDRRFTKITGIFTVDRIEVGLDESDEELKDKAGILKRSDEINQFNAYHGSWVYELESFDGEKLELLAKDIVE